MPITFQTLGVMLAGAILGARKGALSVLLEARRAIPAVDPRALRVDIDEIVDQSW